MATRFICASRNLSQISAVQNVNISIAWKSYFISFFSVVTLYNLLQVKEIYFFL